MMESDPEDKSTEDYENCNLLEERVTKLEQTVQAITEYIARRREMDEQMRLWEREELEQNAHAALIFTGNYLRWFFDRLIDHGALPREDLDAFRSTLLDMISDLAQKLADHGLSKRPSEVTFDADPVLWGMRTLLVGMHRNGDT
jgi:hypothetical protein